MVRILIADDHGIVRAGVRSLLDEQPDMEVVGEAANGAEAADRAKVARPDVVLMDMAMPVLNGIQATTRITEEAPDVRVILLTVHDDQEFLLSALKAGASGYVLKHTEPDELLSAIRAVSQGQAYLSPLATRTLVNQFASADNSAAADPFHALTLREREILKMAADGKSTREMAEVLFLSERTVEKHRQSGMHKLGIARREELTKYALRKGLIDP